MLKINVLNSKMALFEDSIESLANYLGISRQTLTAKIQNASFNQEEIGKIIIRYQLTPEKIYEIFFS